MPHRLCGFCVCLCFCYALRCVLSSFAIILKRKRELVVLLLLSYGCLGTVNVMWLFLTTAWVGLQCVVVVFSDHIHLFFSRTFCKQTGGTLHTQRLI